MNLDIPSDVQKKLQSSQVLEDLYRIAKEVNDLDCPIGTDHNFHPYSLLGSDQRHNACILRSKIQDHMIRMTDTGIPIGKESIRSIFSPFHSVTTSLDSYFGMVAEVGLDNSPPFIIMKYAYKVDPLPIIYDLVIGLIINELRYHIPNVMYTYGGIYCSPPVNIHQVARKLYDEMVTKWMTLLKEELMKYKLGQLYKNKLSASLKDRIGRVIKSTETNKVKEITKSGKNWMEWIRIDFLRPLMMSYKDRVKIGKAAVQEEQDIREWSKWISAIERTPDLMDRLRHFLLQSHLQFLQKKKNTQDFDPELFCDPTREKGVMTFTERIPTSMSFKKAMEERAPFSEAVWVSMWLQMICTLKMAWDRYHFVHADLHGGNILIRELEEEIEVRYEIRDDLSIQFSTRYLAVMIDYGLASVTYKGKQLGRGNRRIEEDLQRLYTSTFRKVMPTQSTKLISRLTELNQELDPDKQDSLDLYYTKFIKIASEVIEIREN